MTDFARAVLDYSESFRWLFFIALLWALYRYVNHGDNPLRPWHFIASRGLDGNYYADLNKLGQVSALAVGSFAVIQSAPHAYKDYFGFSLVLTAYFAFAGGVAAYAATLRAKATQTQTTIVTEPAAEQVPTKVTKTVTEPASTPAQPPDGAAPIPAVIVDGPGPNQPLNVREQPK